MTPTANWHQRANYVHTVGPFPIAKIDLTFKPYGSIIVGKGAHMHPEVFKARVSFDTKTLSKLGCRGALVRNKKRRETTEKELRAKLRECEEMAQEAHEDICPVDD